MSDFPLSRAQGAFLGLALGDAYGRPLKFKQGLAVRNHRINIDSTQFNWSDDTHMALYVADAILAIGNNHFDIQRFGDSIGHHFTLWLHDPLTPHTSPGNTNLAGVRKYEETKNWKTSGISRNDGAGAIMRTCPLPIAYSQDTLDQAATASAMITHRHPNAIGTAVVTCRLLRAILEKGTLTEGMILEQAHRIRQTHSSATEVPMAMEAAILQSRKANLEWLDEGAIPPADGGWHSPSVLGLALAAALRWGKNFEVAVDKAARIDGNSDGVAALTGMFLGAVHGLNALPMNWLKALPMAKDIAQKSEQLWNGIPSAQGHGSVAEKLYKLQHLGAYFHPDSNIQLGLIQVHAGKTNSQQIIALRELANELGEALQDSPTSMYVSVDPALVPAEIRKLAAKKQEDSTSQGEAYVEDESEDTIYEDAEIIVESQQTRTSSKNPNVFHTSTTIKRPKKSENRTPEVTASTKTEGGKRTSLSDPIIVNWVAQDIAPGRGKFGITFAPGKRSDSYYGKPWDRRLDIDLNRLRAVYGVDVLISLVEDHELDFLKIPDLVVEASKRNIAVIRSPIVDGDIPSGIQALYLANTAKALSMAGLKVVFHCRGGLGRAGTICACSLIGLGKTSEEAIEQTRKYRRGAIENRLQEEFVLQFMT